MVHQPKSGAESPVKQALLEIRRLKARLDEAENANRDPIAIIGIGLRLPGGIGTPDTLWEKLSRGFDAVGTIPASRWRLEDYYDENPDAPGKAYSRHGAFVEDADLFDADFFGISPREAQTMDPQQRLLMEVAWEALEHAGIAPDSLWGRSAGIYLGIASDDYGRRLFSAREKIDHYFATGNAFSVAAGRLSYFLSLKGPCVSIDTACSASLVAVHLACQSLRLGESDLAVAGGVNLILSPDLHINFCKSQMLSKSGRCRTFDKDADGYVRGEGCGLVVLKPLSKALSDGNPVIAVIRGSAVNQDGRSGGLTAPNGPSQEAVIHKALKESGVPAGAVSFVEAHGTGTSLGDPIEIGALGRTYCKDRPARAPLWVGSAKTNFGHLEAAAGVVGLIKAALMVRNGRILPNLHFKNPNPHIPWSDYALQVATREMAWPSDQERVAGVSSFGFSGTNAHIVLSQPPENANRTKTRASLHQLVCLSAKSAQALKDMAGQWRDSLMRAPGSALASIAATSTLGRSHFEHRLAAVAGSTEEAARALDSFVRGAVEPGLVAGPETPQTEKPEIIFWYPGQNGFFPGMGRELYETEPVFRQAADQCDRLLHPFVNHSIVESLYGQAEHSRQARDDWRQASLFLVQYALTALLKTWGIAADSVMARGIGSLAAACGAGLFELEDLAEVVSRCGRGQAYGNAMAELLQKRRIEQAHIDLICPLTGQTATIQDLNDSAFWQRLLREEGGDATNLTTLDGMETQVLVTLGPVDTAGELSGSMTCLACLDRTGNEPARLLRTLGEMYVRGNDIQWREVHVAGQPAVPSVMPAYPFQRKHFWFETESAVPQQTGSSSWKGAVAAARHQSTFVPLDLDVSSYPEKWRRLDTLTQAYMENCLRDLDLFRQTGEVHTLETLLETAGVNPQYRHMMARWLEHLVNNGSLQASSDGTYAAGTPLAGKDIEAIREQCLPVFADTPFLLDYVTHCGSKLADVITGRESALETLFPGGSYKYAEALYRDWSMARYFNAIVRAALGGLLGGRPVNILEIGAGTGGTTESVIETVPSNCQYVFTDLSDFFIEKARARFGHVPGFRTAILDIEKAPGEQGLPEQSFHAVVASNVLHATQDLDKTLHNVRRLLVPGGGLLLYETTAHPKWFDITTGLIEGWQRFHDSYRSTVPLIGAQQWRRVLEKNGFTDIHAFPEKGTLDAIFFQHTLVARTEPSVEAHKVLPLDLSRQSGSSAQKEIPAAGGTTDNGASVLRRLIPMTADERREQCRAFVSSRVAMVMHKDAATVFNVNHRLLDLGVDSLMALELRNMLARGFEMEQSAIPATLVFDHPTIAAIADYLLETVELVDNGAQTGESETAAPQRATAIRTGDETVSGDDIKRMLAEKLSALDRSGTFNEKK